MGPGLAGLGDSVRRGLDQLMRRKLSRRQNPRMGEVTEVERRARELGSPGDPELGEHVAQMRVDRARRQVQGAPRPPCWKSLADELCDLQLLRRELRERRRVALVRGLSRCAQLGPRPVGPRRRAERLEALDGQAQVGARVSPVALSAQVLAVVQARPRRVERSRVGVQADRRFPRGEG